jgi:hypothetical protein
MLTIERLASELLSLPIVVRAGLLILVLGGVADVVVHLEAVDPGGHAGHAHVHTGSEVTAHLIGFVGMVIVLLGVVVDGVRRTHPGRSAGPDNKGGS